MIRYEVWTLILEAWSQDNLVFRLYTVYTLSITVRLLCYLNFIIRLFEDFARLLPTHFIDHEYDAFITVSRFNFSTIPSTVINYNWVVRK